MNTIKNLSRQFLSVTFLSIFLGGTVIISAKNVEDKVKDVFEEIKDSVKKIVDKMGDNMEVAQEYLEHYHWKGVIQDKAESEQVTLSKLRLNDHKRVIIVRPGEQIQAEVKSYLNPKKCHPIDMYRVVVGFKGEGPQACIVNSLGASAGESHEKFILVAPQKTGIYQIRFRVVESFSEKEAFNKWEDDGKEPSGKTTIGLIYVK